MWTFRRRRSTATVDIARFGLSLPGMPNYTNSVWSETTPAPPYPALAGNVDVDVAIVGGGITGITAALLLQREGRRVAVIEARRIGKGETDKSTAHLTEALDVRYHTLISRFGIDGARLAALGQREAIERIALFADEVSTPCDFRRIPGFLFAETSTDVAELAAEEAAVRKLGLLAVPTGEVPLPFPIARALRFDNQATLQPRAYLQGLAEMFAHGGGKIFEETQVVDVDEGEPCRVITERGVVMAREVIVAAHVPVSNRVLLHTKLAAYRTYAVGVALPDGSAMPDGLFWDLAEPYHYIRGHVVGGRNYLIVGGEDHKVGESADTHQPFERLELFVRDRFRRPVAPTDYRWSGQIVMSVDGLPYVGRNAMSSKVFVATGYAGNGITQGTLAAMVLADEISGRPSRYGALLDATRIKPLASVRTFIAENADFPKHLLGDRLPLPGASALEAIAPGEGNVLSIGGKRLAVYRNGNGELSALSPVCTHLGCLVHWNTTEKSWDCPCHGSRFDPHGRVLNGPAVAALSVQPLPPTAPEPEPDESRYVPTGETAHASE
jgi:glycine/D-amino acid oxidase-like deaminating enzyme/nitrite reductase/ring-hydroxylating ferredoxin subunit